MLLPIAFLIFAIVHFKTTSVVEAYNNYPSLFPLLKYQQQQQPYFPFPPPRFGVYYLINRGKISPPPPKIAAAAAPTEYVSVKIDDIDNEINEDKKDNKLKPSGLLLVEDIEEEPDYAALFQEDNEKKVEKKNENVHRRNLLNPSPRRRYESVPEGDREYRGGAGN